MSDQQQIRTQHVTQFSWSSWKPSVGVPDLSPGSLEGNLLLTIRDATEMASGELIGASVRKSEKDGVAYSGPKTLEEVFKRTFASLDSYGMKMLKKTFDTVLKNYYTVIFTDPQHRYDDFIAYASPGMYYDLVALIKEHGSVDKTGFENEMAARMAKEKSNACIRFEENYLCGQPVSGRVLCKHWLKPEEGNKFQCYFQERNPNQTGTRDAFLCACGEAWDDNPGVLGLTGGA